MRLPPEHPENRMAQDMPPNLRQIDRSLGVLAERQSIPIGMTQRVYEASVQLLPAPRLRLRRAGGQSALRPMRIHRPLGGQLAMAASIGLTFALVAWFLAVPTAVQDSGSGFAGLETGEGATIRTVAHRPALLSAEAEWLLLETGFNGGRAGYLVDTRDLTIADLRRESQRLFDEFEL